MNPIDDMINKGLAEVKHLRDGDLFLERIRLKREQSNLAKSRLRKLIELKYIFSMPKYYLDYTEPYSPLAEFRLIPTPIRPSRLFPSFDHEDYFKKARYRRN